MESNENENKDVNINVHNGNNQKIRRLPFAVTSTKSLVIWSICTLGLYEIWWMYKVWKYLRDQHGVKCTPWVRALIFTNLWIFSLCNNVKKVAQEYKVKPKFYVVGDGIAFLLFHFIFTMTPITLFNLLGFLFIILLIRINDTLNEIHLETLYAVHPVS